jgi:hypothetical protein
MNTRHRAFERLLALALFFFAQAFHVGNASSGEAARQSDWEKIIKAAELEGEEGRGVGGGGRLFRERQPSFPR